MANYNSKNKNTYCPFAWEHQMIDSDGSYRLCCIADDKIKDNNGKPFNVRGSTLEEVWNSEYMQNVRRSMLNGEKISDCRICYKNEEENLYSYRQSTIAEKDMGVNSHIAPITEDDIVVKNTPSYYDFRFGNLCNLKCVMCGPHYSTEHQSEFAKFYDDISVLSRNEKHNELCLVGINPDTESGNEWIEALPIYGGNKLYEWAENIEVFDKIIASVDKDSTDTIYLTGGEPTIVEGNFKMLKALVNSGHCKHITVIINTNCTNLNANFYNILYKFHSVLLNVSIDGTKETLEYIRYPSKWKQIDKNLNKIVSEVNEKQLENFRISFASVIQMLNAFNLEELVQYYLDLKSKSNYPDNITIVPTVLEGPQWYDITNINSWVRRKIDTQLQTYKGKDESLDSWLESVHKCLSNSEHEGHNLNINTAIAKHVFYKKYRKVGKYNDWFYNIIERII